MLNEKLGFAIIGCGMISKWHAESILDSDANLIGAWDKRQESALAFAEEYGCKVFSSAEEMLASDEVDIVCICVPSGLHAQYAIMVANAGKHFVVEKPMAITRQEITAITEACEKNGVKGCVISQLRFSPVIQAVKKAIDGGALGKILFVELSMKYYRSDEYFKASPWRGTHAMDGGGALMNQGIHGIDLVQFLAGPICSVQGLCKTLAHDIEVEDTASLTVEYENGAIGSIIGTTSVLPGYPRVLEISGTNGTIALTEDAITRWDVEGTPKPEVKADSAEIRSFNNPTALPTDNHKAQIRDMIEAVKNNRRPGSDVYEGRKAVEVILTAYEASKLGKKLPVNQSK